MLRFRDPELPFEDCFFAVNGSDKHDVPAHKNHGPARVLGNSRSRLGLMRAHFSELMQCSGIEVAGGGSHSGSFRHRVFDRASPQTDRKKPGKTLQSKPQIKLCNQARQAARCSPRTYGPFLGCHRFARLLGPDNSSFTTANSCANPAMLPL